MNHLDNILTRQKNTRLRDALFAMFVALSAMVSISALSSAAQAASTHLTAH